MYTCNCHNVNVICCCHKKNEKCQIGILNWRNQRSLQLGRKCDHALLKLQPLTKTLSEMPELLESENVGWSRLNA